MVVDMGVMEGVMEGLTIAEGTVEEDMRPIHILIINLPSSFLRPQGGGTGIIIITVDTDSLGVSEDLEAVGVAIKKCTN
jgi:hypothetical protein